jgi:integrase
VFPTLQRTKAGRRRGHLTPSTRDPHWDRVRCTAGLPNVPLYLATRHYLGWFALNRLNAEPWVIALWLGHKDGGTLVKRLYGHPDAEVAREIMRELYAGHTAVTPLRTAVQTRPRHEAA